MRTFEDFLKAVEFMLGYELPVGSHALVHEMWEDGADADEAADYVEAHYLDDYDGQPDWHTEWADFGEEY